MKTLTNALRIHRFVDSTTVLGPGNRSALWLQGCLRNCPQCMSPQSQPLDAGDLIPIDDLVQRLQASGLAEVTISGGEPFLQVEGLATLTGKLKDLGFGILIYTGYTMEALVVMKSPAVEQVLENIDLLIDGEYVDELNDGRAQIGSSNQRLFRLTDRYSRDILQATYSHHSRDVEFIIDREAIFVIGVPHPEELTKIRNILTADCDKT